jgi:hypothetical protein
MFGDSVHFGTWTLVPLHILDVPISLATDTLCLPWDVVTAIESRKEKTNAVREPQDHWQADQMIRLFGSSLSDLCAQGMPQAPVGARSRSV